MILLKSDVIFLVTSTGSSSWSLSFFSDSFFFFSSISFDLKSLLAWLGIEDIGIWSGKHWRPSQELKTLGRYEVGVQLFFQSVAFFFPKPFRSFKQVAHSSLSLQINLRALCSSRKHASTRIFDGLVVLDASLFSKLSNSILYESGGHCKEFYWPLCSTSAARLFDVPLTGWSFCSLQRESMSCCWVPRS